MIDKPSRRSTNHLSLILRFVDQAFEFFSCDNKKVRDNTSVNLSLLEGRGQKAEGRREERIKNCTSVFAALVKRRIVSASAGDTKRHSFNLTFLEVGFSCLLASFGLGKLNLVVEGV